MQSLPAELFEAAAVDGCNRWQVLQKVVVPLAAPGIATTAIFAFLLGWNEFLFSLILAGPDSRTLPVLIASFDTDRGVLWGQFSAAAVSIMPPLARGRSAPRGACSPDGSRDLRGRWPRGACSGAGAPSRGMLGLRPRGTGWSLPASAASKPRER
jgi:Binding-protein-dependent transport system inner membrane component